MFQFFNKLSISLAVILLANLSLTAQITDQFVEIKFTPNGKTIKEVIKYTGEDAKNFDLTNYINENISKGHIYISGRTSSDLEYTRIKFDSKKVETTDATSFCQSVNSESKPFIGVASSGMDDFSGVLLERVIDNSAAAEAAFNSGDVISYIDDTEIRSVCDLKIAVSNLEVGQQVEVTYDSVGDIEKKHMVVGARKHTSITWKPCVTATAQVDVTQPSIEITQHNAFEVFPNPSNGISTITFEDNNSGKLSVKVFDLQGKKILQKDKVQFDGFYQDEINIANQPSGIYIIELVLNGKKFTKELILARK